MTSMSQKKHNSNAESVCIPPPYLQFPSCCLYFNRDVGCCRYLLIEARPPGFTFLNKNRFSGLGGNVGVIHKIV